MIELNIPGYELIQLRHLVTDVNGILAICWWPASPKALLALLDRLELHLLTADTRGR